MVARSNLLVLYTISEQGLVQIEEMDVYGTIIDIVVISKPDTRAGVRRPDQLLLIKESSRRTLSLLTFKSNRIVVSSHVILPKPLVSITACLCRYHVGSQVVGLHHSHGLIQFFKLDRNASLQNAAKQNERLLEEPNVVDFQFFFSPQHKAAGLCVAILHVDHVGRVFVTSHPVKDLGHVISHIPINHEATMLIPVPQPVGGFAIAGGAAISYVDPVDPHRSKIRPVPFFAATAATVLSPRTFLVGGEGGVMLLLKLGCEDEQATPRGVDTIIGQVVGVVPTPSALVSLGSGIVFVGSELGNSQLLRLLPPSSANAAGPGATDKEGSEAAGGDAFEVLQDFVNAGPIVDFCVIDMERHGQCRMVACTGAYADGAVSFFQNGIGLREEAAIDVVGMNNVWGLREAGRRHESLLVQSFTAETRFMKIDDGDMGEVTETMASVFDVLARTIHCANIKSADAECCVQVTSTGVRIARIAPDAAPQPAAKWAPPAGSEITHASSFGDIVGVVVSGKKLILLQFSFAPTGSSLTQCAEREFSNEVSSLHISTNPSDGKLLVFVGTWVESSLHLLGRDLALLQREVLATTPEANAGDARQRGSTAPLGGVVVARDILCAHFGQDQDFVFVALRDGDLVVYRLHSNGDSGNMLGEAKAVSIGSTPVSLALIAKDTDATSSEAGGQQQTANRIFMACDRPTVASFRNGRIVYSVVNVHLSDDDVDEDEDDSETQSGTSNDEERQANDAGNDAQSNSSDARPDRNHLLHTMHVASVFDAEDFPNAIVFVTSSYMSIGTLDALQSQLHVEKVGLCEQPRRITHIPSLDAVAVGTVREAQTASFIRVLDDRMGVELAPPFALDKLETICSVTTVTMGSKEYVVAGTAFESETGNAEPTIGRILILSLNPDKAPGVEDFDSANYLFDESRFEYSFKLEAKLMTNGAVFDIKEFFSSSGTDAEGSSDSPPVKKKVARHSPLGQNPDGNDVLLLTAGVNHAVIVVSCKKSSAPGDAEQFELSIESEHGGGILSLFVDVEPQHKIICVGDVMKSVRVLSYRNILEALAIIARGRELTAKDSISGKTSKPQLIEIAKDFDSANLTALKCVTSNMYLCANDEGDLFTLAKKGPAEPAPKATTNAHAQSGGGAAKAGISDEERFRLHHTGAYHFGGMINRIESGSLVMQPVGTTTSASSSSKPKQKQFIIGTSNGAVGVVATLTRTMYAKLFNVMRSMEAVAFEGSGHIGERANEHERWRSSQHLSGGSFSRCVMQALSANSRVGAPSFIVLSWCPVCL